MTIPGDLVKEITVNWEVKIGGGPMRGDYSTSVEAVNGFILNTHALTKLQRPWKHLEIAINSLKNKRKTHKQNIQQLLTIIPIDLFPGPARNIMNGLRINSNIIDGVLAAKEGAEGNSFRICQKPSHF